MRRFVLLVLVIALVAPVVLVLSVGLGRGQEGAGLTRVQDVAGRSYTLGQVVEGDGPLFEDLSPDALPPAPDPIDVSDIPAPEGYPVDFRHYATSDEIGAFLDRLESEHPDLLEVFEIGRSSRGRRLMAARVANEALPGPVTERPALYIDGQHHAREMIGSELALYTLWYLVRFYGEDPLVTRLVDTRTVYIVPSVNIDGNDIALTDSQAARKTANPTACDDDGDGRLDEDASHGYGYGTHSLTLYSFRQDWADAHPDNPFVPGWRENLAALPEDLGRYTGAFGGPMVPVPRRDLDGDGETDEDEIGGVDANRNYDAWWWAGEPGCASDDYRGPTPFSEPETAAVRDFVEEIEHLSTAISYHSGVDLLLHPWGWSRDAVLPDAWRYELLARKGSQLTAVNGFPGSPHTWTAWGLYAATGSTMDYFYADRGAYTFTPEVYGGSGRTVLLRLGNTGTFTVGQSTGAGYNPSADQILASADRWHRFALYLLAATPNIELDGLAVADDALVIRLGNDGALDVLLRADLRGPDGHVVAAFGPVRLAGGVTTWTLPLSDLPDGALELTVTADQPIGTRPHRVELGRWVIELGTGGVTPIEGRLLPWEDLGAQFPGGWWAGPEWDEPDRYHVPGDRPISITPPVPSPTPLVPMTPTPGGPTPPTPLSPTPTMTAIPPSPTNTPADPTETSPSPTEVPPTATTTATATATATAEATSPTEAPTRWTVFLPWGRRQ